MDSIAIRREWVAGDDFTMVSPDLVRALAGDVTAAAVLARIRYRARVFGYDQDGRRWWRAALDAIAGDVGISTHQARRALERLLAAGCVVKDKHRATGIADHTLSYAIVYAGDPTGRAPQNDRALTPDHDWALTPDLPSRSKKNPPTPAEAGEPCSAHHPKPHPSCRACGTSPRALRAAAARAKPPWCGSCDERTRLVDHGTVLGRCPECHPLSAAS